MVQGRLQCLGSPSRLKLRFGGGYLLEVHAPDDDALQERLAAFIARELGGQQDEGRHLGYAKYRVPADGQVGPCLLCRDMRCAVHMHGTRHSHDVCEATGENCIKHAAWPWQSRPSSHFRFLVLQSMARVFRLMEEARSALGVQAYGVSLPTLEQVFLRVVGHELQG
jgi:hypothetical protein